MVNPLEKDGQYQNPKTYTSVTIMVCGKIVEKMDYGVNQALLTASL
jgi:hypothetical protein